MTVSKTQRLVLREVNTGDAAFMLTVLNDPAFLRYIGDRGVRSEQDARDYIHNKMLPSYRHYGFGMYVVERSDDQQRIGICGLVRRPGLDDADLGFAFLPDFRGQGYAGEASQAVLQLAADRFALPRVAAITSSDNAASVRLLGKLGFRDAGMIRLPGSDERIRLFMWKPENQ